MYKLFYVYLILCSPLLRAVEIRESILRNAIEALTEHEWSLSGAKGGGYIFKIEHDLIGGTAPEILIGFSAKGGSIWHVFDSNFNLIEGQLNLPLHGKWQLKQNFEESSILDTYLDRSDMMTYIVEQKISSQGIVTEHYLVGTDRSQSDYQKISSDSETLDGYFFSEPKASFISLEDYLLGSRDWQKYQKQEWRLYSNFYTRNDEWTTHEGNPVTKIWHLTNVEGEKVELFTKDSALTILSSTKNQKSTLQKPKTTNIRTATPFSETQSNEITTHQRHKNDLPLTIAGLLSLGIIILVIKIFNKNSIS